MKHTFIGNNLEGLTDMEINVLQVALTHLIEELEDSEDLQKGRFSIQLNIAKKLYQGLGGNIFPKISYFWDLKKGDKK